MFSLSPEVQLNIFKLFNFNQILPFQQTSRFYKNFIKEYEQVLARKKFDKLEIVIFMGIFYQFLFIFSFMDMKVVQVIMNYLYLTPNFMTFN